MKMLTDALELIVESESFSRIYSEIRNNIVNSEVGAEEGGNATSSWLAGMMASRGSSQGKLSTAVAALDAGRLDPESKEYRDAVRTKIAFEVLYKNGMVKQDERGRYIFPSSSPADSGRRKRNSEFRDFLSAGFNHDKVRADTAKSFREDKDAAISELLASIPPEQQTYAQMYSKLTVSAYNLLVNLYKKRGPKDVANFRDTLNRAGFKESTDLALLRELGFVNDQNLLNRGVLAKFGSFMKSATRPQLMALNKDVAQTTKTVQHTRQRTLNAAGTGQPEAEDEEQIQAPDDEAQFSDDMTDEEKRAKYSRIRDIEGGTKASSKNDRAGGYNNTFSDLFKQSFN